MCVSVGVGGGGGGGWGGHTMHSLHNVIVIMHYRGVLVRCGRGEEGGRGFKK